MSGAGAAAMSCGPLYERFVGERDRKVFGEYYTPDWLAGLIVEELLDDAWCARAIAAAIADERNQGRLAGIGFLDPACGSGTILYHAARRLLEAPALDGHTAPNRAAIVARLVNGIDVHPVAAEISRATLLRALPAEPPGGKAGIRIYEGDSLLVHADDDTSLFRPQNGEIRIATPQGRELLLPRSFVDLPSFADDLRRLVEEATRARPLSADIRNSVPEEDRAAVEACHAAFIEIVAEEGNSVWTWYIANTTGPIRLSDQKVDRIVANPPWVSMTDIQAEARKRALEQFAERRPRSLDRRQECPAFRHRPALHQARAPALSRGPPTTTRPPGSSRNRPFGRAGGAASVNGTNRSSRSPSTLRPCNPSAGGMPDAAASCSNDDHPHRSYPGVVLAPSGPTVQTVDPTRPRGSTRQGISLYSKTPPHRSRAGHPPTSTIGARCRSARERAWSQRC